MDLEKLAAGEMPPEEDSEEGANGDCDSQPVMSKYDIKLFMKQDEVIIFKLDVYRKKRTLLYTLF